MSKTKLFQNYGSMDEIFPYLNVLDCPSSKLNFKLHICTSQGFHIIEKAQWKNALLIKYFQLLQYLGICVAIL